MQSPVNVVDLNAYRVHRVRQQELAGAPLSAFPVAWVIVWFAPVLMLQPAGLAAANAR